MRRLLRDVADGRDLGDTTTLADPGVVSAIAEGAADISVALVVGVLPRLRQAAVVPEDGAVVQARLALLLVLHDRVALDLGRHLHLLEPLVGGRLVRTPSMPDRDLLERLPHRLWHLVRRARDVHMAARLREQNRAKQNKYRSFFSFFSNVHSISR